MQQAAPDSQVPTGYRDRCQLTTGTLWLPYTSLAVLTSALRDSTP